MPIAYPTARAGSPLSLRQPLDRGSYRVMRTAAMSLLALTLAACTCLVPEEGKPEDDAAGTEDGPAPDADPKPPADPPEPTEPALLTCEQKLETCTAALDACEADKPE